MRSLAKRQRPKPLYIFTCFAKPFMPRGIGHECRNVGPHPLWGGRAASTAGASLMVYNILSSRGESSERPSFAGDKETLSVFFCILTKNSGYL